MPPSIQSIIHSIQCSLTLYVKRTAHSSKEKRKGFTLAKLNPIQHYHGQLLPDISTYNIVSQISQQSSNILTTKPDNTINYREK